MLFNSLRHFLTMGRGSLGSSHNPSSAPIICGTWWPAFILSDSVPLFTSIEFKTGTLFMASPISLHCTQWNGWAERTRQILTWRWAARFARVFSLLNKSAIPSQRITNRAIPWDVPNPHSELNALLQANNNVWFKAPSPFNSCVSWHDKWDDKGPVEKLGRSSLTMAFAIGWKGQEEAVEGVDGYGATWGWRLSNGDHLW